MKSAINAKVLRGNILKLFLGTGLVSVAVYGLFQVQGQREQKLYHALIDQADVVNSVRVLDGSLLSSIAKPSQPFSSAQIARVRSSTRVNANFSKSFNSGNLSASSQGLGYQTAQNSPISPPFGMSYAPSSVSWRGGSRSSGGSTAAD